MSWDLFAMDTYFRHSLWTYTFAVRGEMLGELGSDATHLTLFDRADWRTSRRSTAQRHRERTATWI